jgi:hypothetical protein
VKRAASTVLILGWFGCGQQNVPPPGIIQGTNGLALFGNLLFITSTETNEIKVLNVGSVPRDFVRAPNPLEPLSIPVLDRPLDLARDLNYDSNGAEVVGPYLYARGQSSSEISIVGTDPATQLLELKRVLTSGIVTAIAARGPNPSGASTSSTLYFATADTPRCQLTPPDGGQCPPSSVTRATLWQATVPPVDSTHRLSASVNPIPRTQFNSTITSIAIMPNPPNLAIATQTLSLDGGQSLGGQTMIFNPESSAVVRELPFPSAVRYLATNPTVNAGLVDGGTTTLNAGSRLYGILDERSCSSAQPCPAVMAVDTAVGIPDGGIPDGGLLAADSTGMPMVPFTYGTALPMAITLSSNALLPLPNPDAGTTGVSYIRDKQKLTGYVPTSNGAIYFFDAVGLLPINASLVVEGGSLNPPQYFANDGGLLSYMEGPIISTVKTANGKARDENIFVTFQGTIPGFQDLPGPDAGESTFAAPSSPFDGRVRPFDFVVLSGSECGDYSANDAGLVITGFGDGGVLFTDGGVPARCTQSTFSVRAAGTGQPYVVNGTATGYMGRTGPNQDFAYDGGFLYRPCQRNLLSGCTLPPDPQLFFHFGSGDPGIQRDSFYLIASFSGFVPEYVAIDTSGAFFGVEFRFPTNVVNVTNLLDGGFLDLFYVSYPSANAIVEFDPANLNPNTNTLNGVSRFN